MAFGVRSAPGPFHRKMDVTLTSMKLQFVLVYLDETIIFLHTWDKHRSHVRTVLFVLHKAGLTLNHEKSTFFADKSNYHGCLILTSKLGLHDLITASILFLKAPRNIIELKPFFALCNIFRQLFTSSIRLAALLNKKIKMDKHRALDALIQEEQDAFATLKDILRYVRRSVGRLSHYLSKHQRCDTYVPPMSYAYNTQTQKSNSTLFLHRHKTALATHSSHKW